MENPVYRMKNKIFSITSWLLPGHVVHKFYVKNTFYSELSNQQTLWKADNLQRVIYFFYLIRPFLEHFVKGGHF